MPFIVLTSSFTTHVHGKGPSENPRSGAARWSGMTCAVVAEPLGRKSVDGFCLSSTPPFEIPFLCCSLRSTAASTLSIDPYTHILHQLLSQSLKCFLRENAPVCMTHKLLLHTYIKHTSSSYSIVAATARNSREALRRCSSYKKERSS